jgi:glycerol dehydrogenase-like iron-containing ADH family enzyme
MPRSDSNTLAEQCTTLQVHGPLLVVASSKTISDLAPSWETALQTLNISYRVFVFSENSHHEIDEICKEALDFCATAIAVIGTQHILNVVQSAASLSHVQLVTVLYEPR